MAFSWWHLAGLVAATAFFRWRGAGWTAGALGAAFVVVAAPIAYVSADGHYKHRRLERELLRLYDAGATSTRDLQQAVSAFVDKGGYADLDVRKAVRVVRSQAGRQITLEYVRTYTLGSGVSIELDFTGPIARGGAGGIAHGA